MIILIIGVILASVLGFKCQRSTGTTVSREMLKEDVATMLWYWWVVTERPGTRLHMSCP